MRLQLALMAAAATFSAGAAQAASVEVKDAVARITVIPEARSDIKVEIVRPNADLPISVRSFGDRTIVDGGLSHRIRDCNGSGERARVKVRGVGTVEWADMPQVVIHTPSAVVVHAGGAVQGVIGRSSSLELHNSGCSTFTIADVAGDAVLHESGAGSVRMGAASRLEVHLSGAANIHATRVRGVDARLSGAGNVRIDDLSGPLEAQVSGVGKIGVAGGRASTMHASVSGIGSVEFGGTADNLDASISGLGGIRVREVTGAIHKSVSGGGHVSIGPRPS